MAKSQIAFRIHCFGDDDGKSFSTATELVDWLISKPIPTSGVRIYGGNYNKLLFVVQAVA